MHSLAVVFVIFSITAKDSRHNKRFVCLFAMAQDIGGPDDVKKMQQAVIFVRNILIGQQNICINSDGDQFPGGLLNLYRVATRCRV